MVENISLLMQILLWPLCLGMIGLILLQGGAGDISSAFGGGGMLDSTLGVGASKKMAKVTGWLAATFFVFVLFLAIPHKGGFGPKPATPAAAAATDQPAASSPAPVDPSAPVAPSAPVLTPSSAPKLAPVEAKSEVAVPAIDGAVKAAEVTAGEAAAAIEAKVDEAKAAIPAVPAAPVVEAPAVPAAPAAEAKPVEAPAVPAAPAK